MKALSQLVHAFIDAIGTEKSKIYVNKNKNITASNFVDLLYNQSIDHAVDIKKQLITFEVEFTNWCHSINIQLQNYIISKNPHLKEIIDKSGQTPLVLIAIVLLYLLLLVASIYLFCIKGKKKVKTATADTIGDLKLSTTATVSNQSKNTNSAISQTTGGKNTSPSKTAGPSIDTTTTLKNKVDPSSSNSNVLDVDDFVYKLRSTGFKVERIKNSKSFDQLLRLNDNGQLRWSNSFFSKPQNIVALVSAIEGDSNTSFILEFKNKTVHFKIKKSEMPYTSTIMIQYFNAIVKKQLQDPTFIINICKSISGKHDNDIDDDTASVVTVNNSSKASTSFFPFSPSKKSAPKSSSSLPPVKE